MYKAANMFFSAAKLDILNHLCLMFETETDRAFCLNPVLITTIFLQVVHDAILLKVLGAVLSRSLNKNEKMTIKKINLKRVPLQDAPNIYQLLEDVTTLGPVLYSKQLGRNWEGA